MNVSNSFTIFTCHRKCAPCFGHLKQVSQRHLGISKFALMTKQSRTATMSTTWLCPSPWGPATNTQHGHEHTTHTHTHTHTHTYTHTPQMYCTPHKFVRYYTCLGFSGTSHSMPLCQPPLPSGSSRSPQCGGVPLPPVATSRSPRHPSLPPADGRGGEVPTQCHRTDTGHVRVSGWAWLQLQYNSEPYCVVVVTGNMGQHKHNDQHTHEGDYHMCSMAVNYSICTYWLVISVGVLS